MPTANDRFKARFGSAFWYSLAAATALHFLLLAFNPSFALERYDRDTPPPLQLQPAAYDLPPEPAPIARPAFPVVTSGVDVVETFPTVPFDTYVPPTPAPPLAGRDAEGLREAFERFVPSMTAPRVLNSAEVEAALQRQYPALLREAGITGEVGVQLWLDESGRVVQSRVANSSGYEAMDAAALHVADVMRLTPALNRGRPVRVTVVVPVVFRVR